MNLFVVQKCWRPPIIESNILTENTCFGYKITRNHTILRTKCPRIMHFSWSLVHPDDHNSGWKWFIDTKVPPFLYFPVVLYTDGLWATHYLLMCTRTDFKEIFISQNKLLLSLFYWLPKLHVHQKWNWTKNTIQIFQGWIRAHKLTEF